MNLSFAKIVAGAGLVLLLTVAGWFWYAGSRSSTATDNAALLQEAIQQFERDSYSEVLATLQEISSDQAEDWRIPYYMGSSHMMLQDYPEAVNWLEQALALNSRQTGVLYALGVTHYKLGNIGLAKAYFAAVLEIDPGDEHARGLMDIMAGLERQQPGHQEGEKMPGPVTGIPQS